MNNAFKQAAQKVASDLREPTLSDFFVYLGKEAEGIPDLSLAKSAGRIPKLKPKPKKTKRYAERAKDNGFSDFIRNASEEEWEEVMRKALDTGDKVVKGAAIGAGAVAVGASGYAANKSKKKKEKEEKEASSKLRKDVALATLYETLYS